ncbi:SDR family NAD(P)-dependent oxidoreductase [Streptomyces gobitricini]|uniref:SDR family oxidoreductase n=1 Tax=Streptomyces gobitricini TaxID=68211 RepID=A0ABP6A0N7_9ACTN
MTSAPTGRNPPRPARPHSEPDRTRHVLITGANRGLGGATAELLAAHGWFVLVGHRRPATADSLVDSVVAHGGRAISVLLDVTDPAGMRAAAERIADCTGGTLDALINNAGVFLPDDAHLTSLTLETCHTTLLTNIGGPLMATSALLPLLRAADGASVVNISSAEARPERANGQYTCYRASKAALELATLNLSLALRPDRIVVNAVDPGWIPTDMGGPGAPDSIDIAARLVAWTASLAHVPEAPSGEVFSVHALPSVPMTPGALPHHRWGLADHRHHPAEDHPG